MIVVGLTGGIGAGKSVVSSYLKKQNIPLIDTDEIARDLTAPGSAGENALKRSFPSRFFSKNGTDRRALASYCFSSEARTKKLNAVLHPLIEEETNRRLASYQDTPFVFLDVPLLFEAGWDARCDRIAVVECDEKTRLARVLARDGCSQEEVRLRMARQVSDDVRRRAADFLIDNNGSLEQTYAQADRMLALLQKEGVEK